MNTNNLVIQLNLESRLHKNSGAMGLSNLFINASIAIQEQADKLAELEAENARLKSLLNNGLKAAMHNADKIAELEARTECTVESFDLTKRDLEIKRKGFWLGFEDARCHPDEMNILKQWQGTLVFNQVGDL
jgi:hypothetical protein